ncbi:exo-beta-1,4-galactosidase [Flavobacterium gilvum]|uniref:beta-galactosidase n=1 Tax=Flavobacterium gilvum TaxID=1492737 RepID=A0AAC9N423_9FLAO|nr:sugar-binding domain-containing protein [Flavobacterium gilvum]AOW09940.1 beta-glucuronidase [Flavobacterium gilvum]KFC59601.1 beta-glucuronidase [Flavobacterium gilvum]
MKKYIYACLLLASFFALSSFKKDEINLEGDWHFEIDRQDVGVTEKWYNRNLADNIKLPGSMAQFLKGDDITLKTKWTGSIYDSSFYFVPRLKKFRQPGNIHIPFWLTPAKHYVGVAWYQKEVNIPANWKGKSILLHLERAHIETRVWINNKEVGLQNSLVAPHVYDLSTFLTPGKQRISIRIDNRIKEINVGPDSHSVTDHTQGNWNGIIGKIALESSSPVYINDVQIYPDVKNRKARVKITINNTSKKDFEGKLSIVAKSFNSPKIDQTKEITEKTTVTKQTENTIELELPFGKGMQTWDEFDPALYHLEAKLTDKEIISEKEIQFGMREFRIEGNRFMINDIPVVLRGTVHNCEFPLTGYPATTVEAWEIIFQKIKSFGLNHVRFHSWCPPEAAFIAADKIGLYLQPEGPSWPNHGPKIGLGQPVDKFIYDETQRMTKEYGNYASFTMLSAGNEPAGNQVKYLNEFVNFWKEKDNRRVYTGMSVGGSWPIVPNAEYQVRGGVRGLKWEKIPETESDFSEGIAKFKVPFVAHEIGQYCVFPNFDEIKKYTGVYRAKNFEMFREDLSDHHMEDQAAAFLNASGKLQVLCYKNEIEKMLRTPNYGGFQMLGLQDFPGQGTALVGVLDAFFEEKGYVTAKEYSRFCNETVPLAEIPKFVYTNNETFKAEIALFHSGKTPLQNAVLSWTIKNEKGNLMASGSFEPKTFENGNGLFAGNISFALSEIKEASKLNLEVKVNATTFANDWNFWVYPEKNPVAASSIYYTTVLDDKAKEVLNKGGKVFLNAAGKVVKGKEVEMHFLPVFWNTSWFKMRPPHITGMLIQEKSPAFADFPTSFHSDLQWWDIQNRSQVMNLEDFPVDFRPLIQPIDTWFMNRRLALVFEAQVGNGKIIVSSADIGPDVQNKPSSKQLFYSLQKYMNSNKFNPKNKLDFELIKDIFVSPSREVFNTYTKDSPDELKPNSNQNKMK